jgi:glycosyltransferase involved in cell wall biosynthesis
MQVLEDLAKTFPGVNFLWVGGAPPAVEEWRGRLASQGLTNVSLTGFVENTRLPLYQAAADVLLMPYERVIEGSSGGNSAEICSPMKMFEYMAAGRAILSSDLPVLHEVLDTDTAIFCPPEEPSAWERALSGLLENPLAREAMGRRAALAVEQYTWLSRAAKILAGW